jgi:four helix bundle protein
MQIFELSHKFPPEERYSLTDQVRRSSRSVCANLAEAWRKRRYRGAFISKLSDAEAEAAETQTWICFAHSCGYGTAVDGVHEESVELTPREAARVERWVEELVTRRKREAAGGRE